MASNELEENLTGSTSAAKTVAAGDSRQIGRIASLHIHPEQPGAPLKLVDAFDLVCAKGIQGEPRYFGRVSRDTGKPNRRQLSLIEREQIAQHATALGMSIPPGAVRSNIETTGIDLIALIGQQVQIGEAVVFLYAPRDPCAKMDAICQGLRERMTNSRQGVMAEIVRSGRVCIGDTIQPVRESL
jgi:MOSC domain